MEIRTYVGTEFTISSVDGGRILKDCTHTVAYCGDLINPQDLRVLASIIEWGKEQGIELDFSID